MIDAAIISLALGESTITDLIGPRLYSGFIEQNSTLPAASVHQISSFDAPVTQSGSAGVCKSRFQFTCIGRSGLEAKTVATAIRDHFHGLQATAAGVKIFRASAENLFELQDFGLGKVAVLDVIFSHSF